MANKIINGRKYDTNTATLLWKRESGCGRGKSELCLYRKKNGEFFYVYGGYKHTFNGDYEWDWIFEPLTLDEAKSRSEKYLDGDTYEFIFGEVEE